MMLTKQQRIEFGNRVRDARLLLDLNQTELARATGLTASAISHFESGRRLPNIANLLRLLRTLDCSADYLLGR
jgi:transcriptional regulator with XRE-family HTH domain